MGELHEIDEAFAQELKEKLTTGGGNIDGFSFLKHVGREKGFEEEDPQIYYYNEAEASRRPVSKYEKTKFFLNEKELHVRSTVGNFRMTQSVEKTVGTWSNYRNAIMKISKSKRKATKKTTKFIKERKEKNRETLKP